MDKNIITINGWKLKDMESGDEIVARVPGDITHDLYKANKIPDPYYGENFKNLDWILRRDFEYTGEFTLTSDDLASEEIELCAKGIDTFADIFVNGIQICSTENMFLKVERSIKDVVREGRNNIKVYMHSTLNRMDGIDTEGYFGVFNIARLFVRKAQCHFGWDWAPDLCGYGIWDDMYVVLRDRHRIDNVNYWADNNGDVTLFTELNYCINATTDNYGVAIANTAEEIQDDLLEYTIYDPDGNVAAYAEDAVSGKKNFFNLNVDNPRLWWPNGYGEQPLYTYKVTLRRGGRIRSEVSGTFAFREVELVQKPTGADTLGFVLKVNGEKIFVRGSNWVPIDCFTGTVTREKYEKLIRLAKEGNFNMLRVWGGGIYEKDVFYDLCDREGIMVWQDFMLACGDIPEDVSEWVDNMLAEAKYQLARLRVHPCVVCWCGGNEKTGSYALQISRGDRFVDYVLHGLVKTMDKKRPYFRQSPFSYSDVGNNRKSGETHCNSFEPSIEKGIVNYRRTLNETSASFYSECAIMGPNTVESFKKFMPEADRWPISGLWHDRLRENPYATKPIPFAEWQNKFVCDMYGEPKSLEDFTAKGMLIHGEMLTAESDYARSRRNKTGGFLTWMFSDIWPTGTWSCVDYYTEPKAAYYALRRAYAPVRVTFVQDETGNQTLVIMNDTFKDDGYSVVYGEKTIDGRILWQETASGKIGANDVVTRPVEHGVNEFGTYLYAEGFAVDSPVKTLYSVNFWRNVDFKGDYTYRTENTDEGDVLLTVTAKSFVKSLFISLPENNGYFYSDNYIDLEAGETAVVKITSDGRPIDERAITLRDYSALTTG